MSLPLLSDGIPSLMQMIRLFMAEHHGILQEYNDYLGKQCL